jgi:hypothetical protein
MIEVVKKKVGRPPMGDESKTAFFQTRLRPSLKARLLIDAARNRRSLSEEVEQRLENSYRDDEILAAIAALTSRRRSRAALTWQDD